MPKQIRHDNRGDVSMTVGGFRGSPLGEGVESNGVRTRGIPPPPLKECFILKHNEFTPERGFFAPKNVSLWNKLGFFRIWHGFCL